MSLSVGGGAKRSAGSGWGSRRESQNLTADALGAGGVEKPWKEKKGPDRAPSDDLTANGVRSEEQMLEIQGSPDSVELLEKWTRRETVCDEPFSKASGAGTPGLSRLSLLRRWLR